MKFQQVYYVLDPESRILWIGGDWDEFALANGGAAARSNLMLATPLARHVAGETTRAALARMIAAVREVGAPLRIDYRCDSPTLLRRVQLTIQPMKDDRVLMVHDLRDARSFAQALPRWQADERAAAQKCSFCGAVKLPGHGWTFAEDLGTRHPQAVDYAVCPGCAAQIDTVVTRLRQRRMSGSPMTGGFGPGAEG
ncbi:hypothetical protein FBT96_15815 [Rhodobacter capsulatus]|uniref:Uncharacterized protein n=1 Tax=Rhodobacter capsulatus TaxID=1061 RepID=A0A4U1JN36_RHOCA|nr:hypothetical protein FBT96_15815 [Rhodobacter capsulatus]